MQKIDLSLRTYLSPPYRRFVQCKHPSKVSVADRRFVMASSDKLKVRRVGPSSTEWI
jgi:hypothetical protein